MGTEAEGREGKVVRKENRMPKATIIYEGARAWNKRHPDDLAHIEVWVGRKLVWEKAFDPGTDWYKPGVAEAEAYCKANGLER